MATKAAEQVKTVEFFVSPDGNDRWSGALASPNRRRSDGPFATVERAQRAVRALKKKGKLTTPVRVILRGGRYELRKPIVFTPADSGTAAPTEWSKPLGPECDVTYAAYPGETPVLSGGRKITGWKKTKVAGRAAWVARVPEVKRGKWFFTQLWVNGRRARRTRLPGKGLYQIAELFDARFHGTHAETLFAGQDRFRFREGDLAVWRNVTDIEFVALHFWIESRINFKSIDPSTRVAELQWKPRMRLTDDHKQEGALYYVENVFEALREPGQWYLDRPSGSLYYLPRPGETPESAEVIAPALPQLLLMRGDAAAKKPVELVRFAGLTFSHSEWTPGPEAASATPQAACHVPGALSLAHARRCVFTDCAVTHVGTYGIELTDGCLDVDIVHNSISDLGAGGVKVWHTAGASPASVPGDGNDTSHLRSCHRITISDNEIGDGGYRYHQAVGVLIGRCSGNKILHNHIHNFDYTGISVGWTWGYAEGEAYGNIIEYNHVHDIGRGMLSDMGGIYTLGVSPGTRIRNNVFHDVESRGYGGWAIYTDEGSTDILIENNLAYRTKSAGFHQHYGRDNIVRNNIFALGREAQVTRSRLEKHDSFSFTRNIVYCDNDGKVVTGDWSDNCATMRDNLYFNRSGKPLDFAGMSFAKWQRRGMDAGSFVGDPGFANPSRGDFTLKAGAAALKMGFVPLNLASVGPRRRRTRRGKR